MKGTIALCAHISIRVVAITHRVVIVAEVTVQMVSLFCPLLECSGYVSPTTASVLWPLQFDTVSSTPHCGVTDA